MSAPVDTLATRTVPALMEARGVTVRLGGARVLHDVDLEVRPGELLALLGPNGAGKSTLLAALAGDVRPEAGTVLVDGNPLASWTAPTLARRRSVLLQQVTLSFPFLAAQVVAMGRSPWAGTDAADRDEDVVRAAMEACDVSHLADRRFTTLSGGERARVALARVLAQDTPVVLLDEPTAALDLRHQELVLREARRLADAGRGVVVVLHDLSLAAAWAHRVAVLSRGGVAAAGAPRDVLTAELLSEVYGCPVDVFDHPRTGAPMIVPVR
ncbi:heme ABC transporter ATP-binding protein [Sanguibacter sp. 25GB23B1]|uniref:heme ABC transporter ATP-binding protein n=1 Tax=unclassified Sanguibacter TaxID=2645534 RepID=UPI0032AFE0FA